MKYLILIILFLIISISLGSEPNPNPDQRELDSYIEFHTGNLPIILEVPHGGRKIIPGFDVNPKIGGRDSYTLELSQLLRQKMIEKTGKSPYYIALLADRNFIDVNRKPGPKAYTAEYTKKLYEAYYQKIDQAIDGVVKTHKIGLMISIHSGWKMKYEIEIGVNSIERWSTIPTFLKRYKWEIFHGIDGIGGRLFQLGYEVPGFGNTPRTKGWTGIPALTRSRKEHNKGVDGMQFEFFGSKLLYNVKKREKLASDLAKVIVDFVNKYYVVD